MSVSHSDDGEPSAKELRLAREVKRLRYELEVSGRQTPMLRAIIEGSPDALALLSLRGEVVEHNRAFGKLAGADVPCHGRTVAECLGRPTRASGAPITELLDHKVLSASLEGAQTLVGALGARAGLYESATLRVHPTGSVTVFTGTHSHGQGQGGDEVVHYLLLADGQTAGKRKGSEDGKDEQVHRS